MPATLDRPTTNPQMASGSLSIPHYTVADWTAFEETRDRKHELRNRVFVEIAGATYEHNRITGNLFQELGNVLPDTCEVIGSDQRVYVESTNGLYPDIVVVCGQPEIGVASALYNPVLIVEVLSPSTAGDDRGEKFEKYRTRPSLAHYVLVEQHRPSVEHFERGANGVWFLAAEHHNLQNTLTIVVSGASLSIPLTSIYRRIAFPAVSDE